MNVSTCGFGLRCSIRSTRSNEPVVRQHCDEYNIWIDHQGGSERSELNCPRQSLVASKDSSVQVFDLPSPEPPPAWLAYLAEFAATQTRYDQSHSPDLAKIKQMRAQLLASTANGPWDVFGRWYFAESNLRAISPWSTLSLEEYVESLIALGDKDSLDYASSLAQDHPAWMVKIVKLRTKKEQQTTN